MPQTDLTPRIAAAYELQAALLEPELERAGISGPSFRLLLAVHAAKGRSSQAEIADRMGISPPTLSEAVADHVQRGLITQKESQADRRIKMLRLTDEGEKRLKPIRRAVQRVEQAMVAGMSDAEREAVANGLDKAIDALSDALDGAENRQ